MSLILSPTNFKTIYPQFINRYQDRLTFIKQSTKELYKAAEDLPTPDRCWYLFETILMRESELRKIRLAFEHLEKGLPENYKLDPELVALHKQISRYIKGIKQLLKDLKILRSVFCQGYSQK